jgi:hypothetical protein
VYTKWGYRDPKTGQWSRRPYMIACEPTSEIARHLHHFVTHRGTP